MERIDHSNYEAWLLDRLEGHLSAEQLRMLEVFLLKHPELEPCDEEMPKLCFDNPGLLAVELAGLKRELPPLSAVSENTLEDHLIAHAEGDLTPEQVKALASFLAAHPAHKRSAALISLSRIVPDRQELPGKAHLKRSLPPTGLPGSNNLDDFLIAAMEGDLDPELDASLSAYLLARPEAQLVHQYYQHTRIVPEQLVYEQKVELKKEVLVLPNAAAASRSVFRWRMAAAIAALLGIAIWVFQRSAPEEMIVVEQHQRTLAPLESDLDSSRTTMTLEQKSGVQSLDPKGIPSLSHLGIRGDVGESSNEHPAVTRSVGVERSELPAESHRSEFFALESIDPRSPMLRSADLPVHELRESEVSLPEQNSPTASMNVKVPAAADGIPIAAYIAGIVRESLLGTTSEVPRPLDTDDAIAAVDVGLKTLAGNAAGIAVDRGDNGRVASFDLRLGANFSIRTGR